MPQALDRYWLLTWTTYGTWLPGDQRGFVSPVPQDDGPRIRRNTPHTPCDRDMPELKKEAKSLLKGPPVFLGLPQAQPLFEQFQETSTYRAWTLIATGIMRAHIHLLVGVPGDPDPEAILRDYKAYGSRSLNHRFSRPKSGTWWTEGGSKRIKRSDKEIFNAVRYVARQEKPLLAWVHSEWAWMLDGP